MNIDGTPWRTIWLEKGGRSIGVIDQTLLPHRFETRPIGTLDQAAEAIATMVVRGAPLIGVTGAYGLMLALQVDPSDASLASAFEQLNATRPTAVNLRWALERVRAKVTPLPPSSAPRPRRLRPPPSPSRTWPWARRSVSTALRCFGKSRPPARQNIWVNP